MGAEHEEEEEATSKSSVSDVKMSLSRLNKREGTRVRRVDCWAWAPCCYGPQLQSEGPAIEDGKKLDLLRHAIVRALWTAASLGSPCHVDQI